MAQFFETARRTPRCLCGVALALLLSACSVGFDVPLGSDQAPAWQETLPGYWKVEFEIEEGVDAVAVAELQKRDEGSFRLDLLAEGLTSVSLRFASVGGRDYAVYDLGSYLEFKPLEAEPDLFQLTSGEGTYGLLLLRRDGDQVVAYQMLRDAVERDLASGALSKVAHEGCRSEPPSADSEQPSAQKPGSGSAFTCLVRPGDEAALGAYLEARGDAIFNLEKPARFTKLF